MKKQKGLKIIWVSDPEWLTTFGDLITLLMTFFVLLISFATIDTEKLEETVGKLQGELGILDKEKGVGFAGRFQSEKIVVPENLDNLLEKGESTKAVLNYMQSVHEEISEYLIRTEMNQHIDLYLKNQELVMRIEADKIFDRNLSTFKKKNLWMLDSLFSVIESTRNNMVISAPVEKSFIPSKEYLTEFELSIARAINLCRYFVKNGNIKPKRIGVSEHGKFYSVSHTSDMIDDRWDYIEIILLSSYASLS